MNGHSTENAEQLVMPEPPMPAPAAPEPEAEPVSKDNGAEEGVNAPESAPSAFKRPVVKRTHKWGSRKGRPSKEALAKRAAEEEAARIAALPPGSPGKGWGGARKGAGHPRTGRNTVPVQVTVSKEIKAKLNRLPKRTQSEYLEKALSLMLSIEPPPPEKKEELFLTPEEMGGQNKEIASGEEKEQSPPV